MNRMMVHLVLGAICKEQISTCLYAGTHARVFAATRHHRSSLDTPEQPALHIIEDGVMLNDSEVLHLAEELLVRVDTRAEHLLLCRAHLAHLLSHLVGSYER